VRAYRKKDFPVGDIRRFLEPGPIVLISSARKGKSNIMTLGWQTVMEFSPSRVGCCIFSAHTSRLIEGSRECVINIPTYDLIKQVIGIGNTNGTEIDKFETFGLTAVEGDEVGAPQIKECYANFEAKLVDSSMVSKYRLFVFEVVKAHVARSPKYPQTVHYRGNGVFMISGRNVSYRSLFKPEML
jgi:flavin reductase (DIM6/NTAB) family NADH-FMN oxidoreductase RutF